MNGKALLGVNDFTYRKQLQYTGIKMEDCVFCIIWQQYKNK